MVLPIEYYLWKLFSDYNIYVNDIIIFGSAALAKFGIIKASETHDIDIVINNRSWSILLKKHKPQLSRLGEQVIRLGEIEVFNSFGFNLEFFDSFGFNFEFNNIFSNSVKFIGWHYMHPNDLKEWYRLSGREKDLEKIKKINLHFGGII